ncbi:MAG TPA: crosslink repair DNA glycosylase YcaQ family protein [Pyrinomonadaceae bacterium]|jgi:uncharacterized protein YcaQ|nr:crosslink repair DNA glycosylase YcaQ family protein [Pyrinomonadaceae bacterium]
MNLPTVKAEEARLLLMGAQGLLEDPSRAATPSVLGRLVERMGFVQLDSINVVERAHHLTLASRLDGYRHEHLSRLLERDRRLFEHWTHDASAVPVKWFAHWKPRFEWERARILNRSSWWRERMGDGYGRVVRHVRERIGREGPLRSSDFEHERRDGAAGWWEWKPQKAALEFLWRTGDLTVVRREAFQKVYDLTERVLPEHHAAPRPTEREHVEWACSTALERLCVATPKELAEFWDAIDIVSAKAWCEEAAREGRVTPVLVESLDGSKPRAAYAVNDWKHRLSKLPAPPARTRLLSPFDPVLRDRARARRLFGFDYRFEAFVPGPKRVHGYYVLPVLEGDRLVARLDPKFERREGILKVRRVYWEPDVRVTRQRKKELERALARLASFIGAERFSLPDD